MAQDPFDPGPNPYLMRQPTYNGKTIVFVFAGDLWSVPKEGGLARRLTSSLGVESDPYFSPDGKTIAFTGQYDGNTDVFTMPAEGGVPKRISAHPGMDRVLGWTPDGAKILFASDALSAVPLPRLFTVPKDGGMPEALPTPSGSQVSMNPAQTHIAYVPSIKWQDAWKRYRGGQAHKIWILRLSDSKWTAIPRRDENIETPMWVGGKIFYMSDVRGPVGLYSFDAASGRVTEEIKGNGFDIKSASAGPDAIVYERFGSLNLYDWTTKKSARVPVEIQGDFPEVREEFKPMAQWLTGAAISPTGQRVVVISRGCIFTAPASKGDVRPILVSNGVDRRDPAWSPDGRTLAYVTDVNKRQQMGLYDLQTGQERLVDLGEPPAYYESPVWSPDGSKIAYQDRRHTIWVLDVKTGVSTKVDAGIYTDPTRRIAPRWSPDSKWLTYSRDLESHIQAVFLWSAESGKATQITDGMASAVSPIFDRDGKHLYFLASTEIGQGLSWLNMSSFNMLNAGSAVYAVILKKDGPNPLAPESDEEPIREAKPAAPPAAPPAATPPATPPAAANTVDLEGIERRIFALPIRQSFYSSLEPGPAGSFFLVAQAPRATVNDFGGGTAITRFSFATRSVQPFAQGVGGIELTADGTKVLLRTGAGLAIAPAAAPYQPGTGAVNLAEMRAKIDPMEEWKQMFHLVWRNQKLLFYDAFLHGVDADAMDKRYSAFLPYLRSREDLNYLFTDMLGELSIGHMFIGGGDNKQTAPFVPVGLLGCDFEIVDGKYRLTRVYDGERWNPSLRGPLAAAGVYAKAGEFLLEIDGKPLSAVNDIYLLLEGKAGKQVKVKLGPNADGSGAREAVVVPVGNEQPLRYRAWTEGNRRRVAEATNGAGGYVFVPDTANGGWTEFNRFYFAQNDRKGMVVDERFNGGGLINDYMVDEMGKTLDGVFTPRYGKDWPTPGASLFGPKVMIANELAGSGGDMFPWLFRHRNLGPIIGTRTWGGLVASFGFILPDGGSVRAPDCAFYNPHTGKWDVEGFGVEPDIEVELDPFLWRQGKDSQLERAIVELQKAMKSYKYPKFERPKPRDNTKLGVRW